ncbi:LPXTG-motif cell wall anchor domain-containing protein, partial [Georgenia satyanarayanai]
LSEVGVPPEAGPGTGRLQDTGAEVGALVGLAGLAALVGAGLAVLARRRAATAGQPPGH